MGKPGAGTRAPTVNDARVFECARVWLHDEEPFECVLSSASNADELCFWARHTPWMEHVPMALVRAVERVDLGHVPPCVYELKEEKTGGIGPHVRMHVAMPSGDLDAPATLVVTEMQDRVRALEAFALANAEHVSLEEGGACEAVGDTLVARVRVHRRRNLQLLIARLAWAGFEAYCIDLNDVRVVQYVPDKMTRYRHQWRTEGAAAAAAGPVRDAWRWRLSHLPPDWQTVYTLEGHAGEAARVACEGEADAELVAARVHGMPLPLRSLAAARVREWASALVDEAPALAELHAALAAAAGGRTSVASLSRAQMLQLHECVYSIDYAPYTEEHVARLRHVVFVYALHGHTGRLLGRYDRHNAKRGLGRRLRLFRGETESSRALAIESLNRVRIDGDGTLRGVGGRGYKGIYPERYHDVTPYRPKWRMRRTPDIDHIARRRLELS